MLVRIVLKVVMYVRVACVRERACGVSSVHKLTLLFNFSLQSAERSGAKRQSPSGALVYRDTHSAAERSGSSNK